MFNSDEKLKQIKNENKRHIKDRLKNGNTWHNVGQINKFYFTNLSKSS